MFDINLADRLLYENVETLDCPAITHVDAMKELCRC